MKDSQILATLRQVVQIELDSLSLLHQKMDKTYTQVVKTIYECKGKLVIMGVGKSGYIAKKIAATMTSVGTPAHFLHPTEACHGDLGIVSKKDVVLIISHSGETEEIIYLMPSLQAKKIPLILLSARKNSTLVKACPYFLWLAIYKEACDMDLVPTSSTLVSLAIGDALAITLMKMKNFQQKDFARFHPAGSLGKRLSLRVEDVMLKGSEMPMVTLDQKIKEVVSCISQGGINAAAVVDQKMILLGLITGYDLRKVFSLKKDIYKTCAHQIMNKKPATFSLNHSAFEAMLFMKNSAQILNILPVVEGKKLVGILSLQSLIKIGF